MKKNNQKAIIIISILSIILLFGLIYKSIEVLSGKTHLDDSRQDSLLQEIYENEIKQGPVYIDGMKRIEEADIKQESQSINNQKETREKKQGLPQAYLIVSGAFSSRANAQARVKELKEKGYDPGIHEQKDRGLYLVYLSSFTSRAMADAFSAETKQKGIDNYIKVLN